MNLKQAKDLSLCEELPYWEFVGGNHAHAILTDGSVVMGLKTKLLDIECLDASEINRFTSVIRSTLDSISEGVTVQFAFQVRSDFSKEIEQHARSRISEAHNLVHAIAKNREELLKEAQCTKQLYRPHLLIYLRYKPDSSLKVGFWKMQSHFADIADRDYSTGLDLLTENIEIIRSAFQTLGLDPQQLSRDEMIDHVYRFLNPKRSSHQPAPRLVTTMELVDSQIGTDDEWLAPQSPREQLTFGDLLLELSHFTLDEYHHKVVTLKTLPEVTFAGQLSEFLRMPFHYDLFLSFHVPPQAREMARLQQKRNMAHSLATTQGGRAADLASETKLSSAEELIRELLGTGQRLYSAQLSILLKAEATTDSYKQLNREVRDVLSRFRMLQGAEGMEESVGSWKVAKGNLPAAPVTLERARKIKTNNLADFIPIYGPNEGDDDPVVLLQNRLGGLVAYNPFDLSLPNYNTLVTGSSGAGKSFLNNCLLLQELARGTRAFIIDIGGSYRKLTQALDGQYFDLNLTDNYRINPFALPTDSLVPSSQKLKSLITIVEAMLVEDNESRLSKLERVLLEKAIIELYQQKEETRIAPTLSDLAQSLLSSDEPSMQRLGTLLYTWTGDRPYGRILDGEGSLNPHSSVCTFDLKGLSSVPDLQAVMILILTDFILGQVETDRSCKIRIILDEAWELLKSSGAASFMEYCARTLRKTGSGITFITQGVEEIVASPIGPAILNNTATKFVMLQRGDSKILADCLKLNLQELSLVESLSQNKGVYSEGFMIEGDKRQVIRVRPTDLEYWLSSSDAEDNRYLQSLIEQDGLTLSDAIKRAAELHPNGMAKAKKELQ